MLTRDQWIELVEAVASKAATVRRGDYGEPDGSDKKDMKKWADDLDALHKSITEALSNQGITL